MATPRYIFVGKSGVGKTTLLRRITSHSILESPPTIGVDFVSCRHPNGNLQCWDTSGHPKFHKIVGMFFKDCKVIVYVYDVSDPDSLTYVEKLFRETPDKHEKIFFLVGNKMGPDCVEQSKILRLCEEGNMVHFKCDSRCQESVLSLFEHILYHSNQHSLEVDTPVVSERVCLYCAIL